MYSEVGYLLLKPVIEGRTFVRHPTTGFEGGFPHSDIRGSKLVRSSPRLFAAYHVLHSLRVPRHPPNALQALDRSHYQCPPAPSASRPRGKRTAFHRSTAEPTMDLERPVSHERSPSTRRSGCVSLAAHPWITRKPGQLFSSRCQSGGEVRQKNQKPEVRSTRPPPLISGFRFSSLV
jgi:hypothetical protein